MKYENVFYLFLFGVQVLIIDSRSFLEFNDFHVVGAVNVCCSKLVKRRLQHDKVFTTIIISLIHFDLSISFRHGF